MDQIGSKILEILQTNSRISMSELGRVIGMTQPAVTERVRKLEEKGIISKYRTALNLDKLGKKITAFILMQSQQCDQFDEFCRQSPDVIDLYRISGQYNFLVKVITDSMESLEEFTNKLGVFGYSTTLIVLSTRFEQKPIIPEVTLDR